MRYVLTQVQELFLIEEFFRYRRGGQFFQRSQASPKLLLDKKQEGILLLSQRQRGPSKQESLSEKEVSDVVNRFICTKGNCSIRTRKSTASDTLNIDYELPKGMSECSSVSFARGKRAFPESPPTSRGKMKLDYPHLTC